MPSLPDVMWSSLLFDDSIHRYKLVSLAGKEWEKECRGKGRMEKGQDWHYGCTTPVTACVLKVEAEWKAWKERFWFFSRSILTWHMYVERVFGGSNQSSFPYRSLDKPFLKWLRYKISDKSQSVLYAKNLSKDQPQHICVFSGLTSPNQVGFVSLLCEIYCNKPTSNSEEYPSAVAQQGKTVNERTKRDTVMYWRAHNFGYPELLYAIVGINAEGSTTLKSTHRAALLGACCIKVL